MKLDIEKSFKAPFVFSDQKNFLVTYAIALGFTLLSFIIGMIFSSFKAIVDKISFDNLSASTETILFGVLVFILCLLLTGVSLAIKAFPLGYILEAIKLEVNNNEVIMPLWGGNLLKFFINGLKLILIMFVYTLVLVILATISIVLLAMTIGVSINYASLNSITASKEHLIGFALGSTFGIVIIVILVALMLVYCLIMPMIYVRFAAEQSFVSAFNLVEIFKVILNNPLEYVATIIISIILYIALIVLMIILVCTCIGIIFIPLVIEFIFPIIVLNMFAQIYKD